MSGQLPFDRYKGGGKRLLGPPPSGDGTTRHGYGLAVMDQCGTRCVYCERDLEVPYESWLDLSIDHVVPQHTIKYRRYPEEWVKDLANIVISCRACNEFLNAVKVDAPAPKNLMEFFYLRDVVFCSKRKLALKRHSEEQTWYSLWHLRQVETSDREIP